MPVVSSEQFEMMLRTQANPLIVTFLTETEPEMVKKHRETKEANPFLGRVKKQSKVNGFIGWNYTNSVNNQRRREEHPETFHAAPRKWGTRLAKTALVEHKGNLYVEVKVEKAVANYFVDERPATEEELTQIRQYLPNRDNEGARQEVDKIVVLRDYKLENIKGIRVFGEEYELTDQ